MPLSPISFRTAESVGFDLDRDTDLGQVGLDDLAGLLAALLRGGVRLYVSLDRALETPAWSRKTLRLLDVALVDCGASSQ